MVTVLGYRFLVNPSTKDDYLEIKFNNRNQVDEKNVWRQGEELLSIHSSFVC